MLGPSGCGKTTTLRMIAGFEQPTSGRILLEGQDVSRVPPYRRNVNTVFQHYALFPHMSVHDNVAFGPRSRKVEAPGGRPRVKELLDVVRLGHLAERKPAQLSGGQQQRVALARALVNYPSALLLDEPLGALDLKLRQAMQLELKRIQREVGITFIYVTHDQEEALTMSDRIAVMNEGRVEQIGTPEEIYHAPASVFVANFIGVANLLPARVGPARNGDATADRGRRPRRCRSRRRLARPAGEAGHADGAARTGPGRRPATWTAGASIPVTVHAAIFQGPVDPAGAAHRRAARRSIGPHGPRNRPSSGARPGMPSTSRWDPEAARLLPPSRTAAPLDRTSRRIDRRTGYARIPDREA